MGMFRVGKILNFFNMDPHKILKSLRIFLKKMNDLGQKNKWQYDKIIGTVFSTTQLGPK